MRAAMNGFRIHIIPMLTGNGIAAMTAATMMSVMIFCNIPAGVIGGIISDKVKKNNLKWLMVTLFPLSLPDSYYFTRIPLLP